MRTLLVCALASSAVAAGADERPAEFRFRAPILAAGQGSHYRFLLPEAVYLGAERQDLGDLRVLNASGEPVPHAFLPRIPAAPAPAQAKTARLFPLYGEEAKGLDGVKLDVTRGADGTVIRLAAEPKGAKAGRKLLGYLVDASDLESSIEALIFDWQAGAGFNGTVRVDASDDLARWSVVVGEAPVLMLEHSGERLERKRVELSGRKAKFLRIAFSRVPDSLVLRGVQLEPRGERVEPAREWRRVSGAPVADKRGEYQFDNGGRFPVDRVRLVLPQQNTVARIELLARDRDEARWRHIAAAQVYRLQRNGATVTNPDLRVYQTADRHGWCGWTRVAADSAPATSRWKSAGRLTNSCSRRAARLRSRSPSAASWRSRKRCRWRRWCRSIARARTSGAAGDVSERLRSWSAARSRWPIRWVCCGPVQFGRRQEVGTGERTQRRRSCGRLDGVAAAARSRQRRSPADRQA